MDLTKFLGQDTQEQSAQRLSKEEFSNTFSTHISERILDCMIFREKQMSRLSVYVNF